MGQPLDTSHADALSALQTDLQSHPRMAGYYLIRLIDITRLRAQHPGPESLADVVMPMLDDEPWPPIHERPQDQAWSDYEADPADARAEVIKALIDGAAVGHTRDTMTPAQAAAYFDRFNNLFESPKTYYTGLGFGSRDYAESTGVVIISPTHAGVLCVVEGD